MKPRLAILLAPLATLLAAAPADAATLSASTARRAARIILKADRQVAGYGDTALHEAITATQQKLDPCASGIFALEENASAGKPLAMELGEQYAAGAITEPLNVWADAYRRLAGLPLPAVVRREARAERALLAGMASLDTCGDYQSWQAAGLSPTAEPASTTAAANLPNALNGITGSAERLSTMRAPAAVASLLRSVAVANRSAAMHLGQQMVTVIGTLKSWVATSAAKPSPAA